MAEVTTKYSPIHETCQVGQPYGNPGDYQCGWHTGIDFPGSGVGGKNVDLYSCVEDGTVVYVYKDVVGNGGNVALGNQVQIKDNKTGLYYRYCHMLYGSISLNVGDNVNLNTIVGKMGNTGNSDGLHLHLECSTTQTWQCSSFLNPGDSLGIPNVRGTIVNWDGTITPEPPKPEIKQKKKFKWILYTNKIRQKRTIL